jgi:phenylpyruvate tautomerase PptA (4-oxalocrotonate tautomerase family)
MNIVDPSNENIEMAESPGGLSRRAALKTVTVAGAAAAAGVSAVLADAPAAGFGAPLVEMSFPVGVLTPDQKAAMIKSVTDVVRGAMKLPPDPARMLFVEIFETPEGGFGVNGQAVVPRGK